MEMEPVGRVFQLFIGLVFFSGGLILTRGAEPWQQLVAASLLTLVWAQLGARG